MKAAKEENEGGRKRRYLFNFNFISGFNYLSVGKKFFLNPNKIVASPRQGVKKTLVVFRVDMSIFGIYSCW